MAGDEKKDNLFKKIVGIGLSRLNSKMGGQDNGLERRNTQQVGELGTEPESTEWISQVVKVLWPSVQEYAPEAFKEYMQPLLKAQMPNIFPDVNFQRVTVGEIPPVIKSMRVQSKNQAWPDMVGIEAEVEYDGDMHIELALGKGKSLINFGVSELTMRGTIEILIGPRIARIPFFSAQQISFLNPPEMDYKLTGVASIAQVDFFKAAFREATDKIFNATFVLPTRTCMPIFTDIDFLQCTVDHIGVLRVRLISGHEFPNTDFSFAGMGGAPDVYLRLTHSGISKNTQQYKKKRNPEFKNETMDFVIASTSTNQMLDVKAYDWDLGQSDDLLGTAKVDLSHLVEEDELQLPLKDELHGSNPYIKLRAKRLNLSYEKEDISEMIKKYTKTSHFKKNCAPMLLKVNIAECQNLPDVDAPYVKFKVGSKIVFETGSAFHGRLGDVTFDPKNPLFMMSFTAFIEEPITEFTKVDFYVLDRSIMKLVGQCSLYITDKTTTEIKIEGAEPNSILRASVKLAAIMDDEDL